MCKVGDIIIIDSCVDHGNPIASHSFVVMDDVGGDIQGLSYDIICNILSSFKDSAQKERKLSYPGNFPIASDDMVTNPNNGKRGYIKTDQLYYFKKNSITYRVIGSMNSDIFQLIIDYINESDFPIVSVTDNL